MFETWSEERETFRLLASCVAGTKGWAIMCRCWGGGVLFKSDFGCGIGLMACSCWVLAHSVDERRGFSDQELHVLIVQLHQRAHTAHTAPQTGAWINVWHVMHKTHFMIR